jgi:GNAT superfamily N-acetyltransferase
MDLRIPRHEGRKLSGRPSAPGPFERQIQRSRWQTGIASDPLTTCVTLPIVLSALRLLLNATGSPTSQGLRQGDMGDRLQVRRAAADDLLVILGLIDEAATWLRTKNTDQWARPWPNQVARDARVRQGIRGGNTWIAEEHGTLVATLTYRPHGNHALWTQHERNEPAVYVSRLIVSREVSGLGIGAAMIDWAGQRAARDWGAHWIRIDVWTTNMALHNYYQARGFRFCRMCPFDPWVYPSAALFQKPISEVDEAAASRFSDVSTHVGMADAGLSAAQAGRLPRTASSIPVEAWHRAPSAVPGQRQRR